VTAFLDTAGQSETAWEGDVASRVVEFFGYKPLDPVGSALASRIHCPFVDAKCIKPEHGACSLEQTAGETFTTTVEQVAYAFVSPVNLPEMGVYEKAIMKALRK